MKFSFILPLLFLLVSCGQEVQPLYDDTHEIKTIEALNACKEIRIPQGIDFTPEFIYHFPQCISNKDENGLETLTHSITLMKKLGISGLTDLVNLIKLDPTSTGNYPLVSTIFYLMERGVFNSSSELDQDSYNKRFGVLQSFQEKMNPYWLTNLIFEMGKKDYLKDLLQVSGKFFDEVNIRPFMALFRAQLEDPKFQQTMIKSIQVILEDQIYYNSLSNLLTIEQAYEVKTSEKNQCIKDWLDPKLIGTPSQCRFQEHRRNRDGEKVVSRGDLKYKNFVEKLTDSQMDVLVNLTGGVVKRFINIDSSERSGILQRYLIGLKDSVQNQAEPFKNALALLDYFFGRENGQFKTKAKDLSQVVNSIEMSLKNGGPIIMAPVYKKITSAKLHQLIEDKIIEGGEVKSCPGLSLAPAYRLFEKNQQISMVFESLNKYFVPTPKCRDNLAPVAAYILEILSEELELNDQCRIDRNGYGEDKPCLIDEVVTKASERLREIDWSSSVQEEESIPGLNKDFVLNSLKELRVEIQDDELYLHWLNLAPGKVSIEKIDILIEEVSKLNEATPEVLAYMDAILSSETEYRDEFGEYIDEAKFEEINNTFKEIFKSNFLEKYLGLKIGWLDYRLEQFNDLFSRDDASNEKMLRILAGVYPGGPYEQRIQELFTFDKVKEKLGDIPVNELKLKEILSRLRLEGVLFHNQGLDSADIKLPPKYLGDPNKNVTAEFVGGADRNYRYQGLAYSSDPYGREDIFSDSFLRLTKMLKENDLFFGANIDGEQSDDFVSWMRKSFFRDYIDSLDTFALSSHELKSTPLKYIDSTDYGPDDVRQFVLFDGLHFLYAPAELPKSKETYEFEWERKKRRSLVSQSFMSFIETRENRWTHFLNLFPESLEYKGPNQEFLSDIYSRLVLPFKTTNYDSIPWGKLPSNVTGQRDLRVREFTPNQLEILKSLTTVNLMTINVRRKFMPLIGVQKECSNNSRSNNKCPINFIDSKDENGEVLVEAFDHYKSFLVSHYHAYFCSSFITGPYSDELKKNLMEQAKIEFDSTLAEKCKDYKNLFDNHKGQINNDLREFSIKEVFRLGKNPKLKPQVRNLSSKIAYERLKRRFQDKPKLFMREFLNSKGFFPAKAFLETTKRLTDHRGYLTHFPGIINIYTNYFFSLLKKTSKSEPHLVSIGAPNIELSTIWYGANIKSDTPLKNGVVQRVLEDKLIKPFREFDSEKPLAEFLVKVLKQLSGQELKYLLSTASYPSDIEALTNFNETMPLLVKFLFEIDPRQDFWETPGAKIFKILLRRENVKTIIDIMTPFNDREIIDALLAIREEVLLSGSTSDQVELLGRFTEYLVNIIFRVNTQTEMPIANKVEDSLLYIIKDSYLPEDINRINTVLDFYGKSDLKDFENNVAMPLTDQLKPIIKYIIKDAYKGFSLYQNYFKNESSQYADTAYLKRIISGLIRPFDLMKGPQRLEATSEISQILQSPILGSWDKVYKKVLFDPQFNPYLLKSINVLEGVDNKVLLDAMDESNKILPDSHNLMKFVWKNIQWESDTSVDTKYAFGSFFRLSGAPKELMEKNVDLMKIWLFRPEKE
ncbi:MAG: hypothetical protein ACO20H_05490 [Bacteriovoracaceae bacterium]